MAQCLRVENGSGSSLTLGLDIDAVRDLGTHPPIRIVPCAVEVQTSVATAGLESVVAEQELKRFRDELRVAYSSCSGQVLLRDLDELFLLSLVFGTLGHVDVRCELHQQEVVNDRVRADLLVEFQSNQSYFKDWLDSLEAGLRAG